MLPGPWRKGARTHTMTALVWEETSPTPTLEGRGVCSRHSCSDWRNGWGSAARSLGPESVVCCAGWVTSAREDGTGRCTCRAGWPGSASLGRLHPELNDGACFCQNLCRILHRVCPGYSACSLLEQPGAEGLWGLPSAGVNASTPLTVALHRPGCRSGSCARAAPQTN